MHYAEKRANFRSGEVRVLAVQVGFILSLWREATIMTLLGRKAKDAARVRYAGADYIVPFFCPSAGMITLITHQA